MVHILANIFNIYILKFKNNMFGMCLCLLIFLKYFGIFESIHKAEIIEFNGFCQFSKYFGIFESIIKGSPGIKNQKIIEFGGFGPSPNKNQDFIRPK